MAQLRMTAQSKVNIAAAKSAYLIPNDGGYSVELVGNNASCMVENGAGVIVYSSMAAAKKAVTTHNHQLKPDLKPTI